MTVGEAMTREVHVANPTQTIGEIARLMVALDTGYILVGDGDKLVGVITDRDIVMRAVAAGLGPDTPVHDIMTREIKYCFDDETIAGVAKNMAWIKVLSLPVVSREKRLVGIIGLGDVARAEKSAAAEVIAGAPQPGEPYYQPENG